MPIRVLHPGVVDQIAAGEVVERPASVVKELVENSLDAGATRVRVEVRGGGAELIRVTDNGEGIPGGEVEVAFRRYSTSKLERLRDLQEIATHGFRGEALPSIAAVARVSLLTRTPGEAAATLVEAGDGRCGPGRTHAGPVGTTVAVRHLFRNVPARLKFLRSSAAETGHIRGLLERLVLLRPDVALALEGDGRRELASTGTGDRREALAAVYGAAVARQLLELAEREAEAGPVSVSGFVSPPSLHRPNRNAISLFVNGRWVQNRSLAAAVSQAYHGLLPEHRHPVAAVFVTAGAGEVDVNVHPAKREVRFRREGDVFAAVQRAVRSAVAAEAPVASFHSVTAGSRGYRGCPAPWRGPAQGQGTGDALELVPPREEEGAGGDAVLRTPRRVLPALRVVGQVQSTYVVAEGPEGMYLIDQHAGHERVLYDRLSWQVGAGGAERQALLEPVAVELGAELRDVLESHVDRLGSHGFEVEAFGPGGWLVRAMPAALRGAEPARALVEALEALGEAGGGAGPGAGGVTATVACHGAVRAGQTLSREEMVELVRGLERCDEPHTCPHGRPTIVHLSAANLEREFARG